MADFLSRENELLGDEFSTPTGGTFATASGDDIDFDLAASAFPDISLDGDIPVPSAPPVAQTSSSGGFSFDDFDSPPLERTTEVKVTGDDEIEKFENEFPEIEMPSVSPRMLYRLHTKDVAEHSALDRNSRHSLLRHNLHLVRLRRSRLDHNPGVSLRYSITRLKKRR